MKKKSCIGCKTGSPAPPTFIELLAAAATGPGLIGFDATRNYVASTIGAAFRDGEVNVKMFPWLAKGDGVTDDWAAIQAAMTYCKNRKALKIPAGVYPCSQDLSLSRGSVVTGENGFPCDPRSVARITTLKFTSTASGTRGITIDQTGAESGYVWGVCVKNLRVLGVDAALSKGIHAENLANSVFENIGVSNFARGLDVDYGMFNVYSNINSSRCAEASLYISGANGITTTQTFNNCVLRESPWGIIIESTATGQSYGSVFNSCVIESTTAGGANVHRSCGATFNDQYCENVPDGRFVADGTMFRLGFDGYEHATNNYADIVFSGGDFGGDNFSLQTAATIIDIGRCNQVSIFNGKFQRAVNGIRCDATLTPNNSVFLFGPEFVSITNLIVNGAIKVGGIFSNAVVAGGRRTYISNGAAFWTSGNGTPEGAVIAGPGCLFTRLDGGAGKSLYVKESGTGNTGWRAV